MKPTRFPYNNLLSLVLLFAFLATSVVIPVVNAQNLVSSGNITCVDDKNEDSRNQDAQLPLAENEKEEENRTERSAEYSFEFCLSQFMHQMNVSNSVRVIEPQISYSLNSPEVPLYLFKRTLLI